MNPGLKRYIEREIIPRYEHFDRAHDVGHVRTVIARSLELAARYEVDADMVYAIAAYHDTGLVNGRENHHLDAGRILAADHHCVVVPQCLTQFLWGKELLYDLMALGFQLGQCAGVHPVCH